MTIVFRKGFWAILSLTCMLFSTGLCAKEKEKREVSDFKNITISGLGTLYIKQGKKEALTIEGEKGDFSEIESEVKDHHLFLGQKNHHTDKTVNYRLTVKNVQNINTSGDIIISGRDILTSQQLNLTLEGSGSIDMKVKVKELNVKMAGNGNIKIAGVAQNQIIKIEGAGKFNGKKLSTNKATITIEGSGDAEINASQALEVKISGFGKVKYYGKPTITQEISGDGEIIPL